MANTAELISRAFWESDNSGVIILSSDWIATTLPPISLGPIDQDLGALECLKPEDSGRYFRYFRRKQNWVFTFQSKRYPQLLDRKARVFLAGDFNQWGEVIGESKWELLPLNDEAGATYEVSVPIKDIPEGDSFKFKFVTEDGLWLDVPDSAPNVVRCVDGIANFEFNPKQSGQHIFRFQTPEGYVPQGNEKIIWRDASGEEVHELPHTQFLLAAATDSAAGRDSRGGGHDVSTVCTAGQWCEVGLWSAGGCVGC